jgi:hypothetical protein
VKSVKRNGCGLLEGKSQYLLRTIKEKRRGEESVVVHLKILSRHA